ncbi:MAG: lycopene cyclase [Isosphaeraceae bacterium]|jgi:lycopene beta-cyclase|nr:MAG: lycopene cyclase [Isosphaeraceae bacterium]
MMAIQAERETIVPWGGDRRLGSGTGAYAYVVVGAGCAGLSLTWYLLEQGVSEPIAVIDRRSRFENDRTWCFWDVEPTPFSDLAASSWSRWEIREKQRTVTVEGSRYSYLRLRAVDFYRRVLERVEAAPNVTLLMGCAVRSRREESDGVVIETDRGVIRGQVVCDASAAWPTAAVSRGPELLQHFMGQTVRADRPVFDPSRATLMDFRVASADGVHFVYLLPFTTTEALVENTYLFPVEVSADRHRAEIAGYLRERYGSGVSFAVEAEESGRIPMRAARFPTRIGRRIYPIGLVGGAARPSSGYAFLRIQRQTRELAHRLARGLSNRPPAPLSRRKYRFLDTVFLQALADWPERAADFFGCLFARAGPDAVVRFLSDRSTAIDDLRIIASLPKWPFLLSALRSAPAWIRLLI